MDKYKKFINSKSNKACSHCNNKSYKVSEADILISTIEGHMSIPSIITICNNCKKLNFFNKPQIDIELEK
jgi:hypothetical protein